MVSPGRWEVLTGKASTESIRCDPNEGRGRDLPGDGLIEMTLRSGVAGSTRLDFLMSATIAD